MNARNSSLVIPALGSLVKGGYFHGVYLVDGRLYCEVTADIAAGEFEGLLWMPMYTELKGASSDFDGLANTTAMTKAGSPLGKAVVALEHAGFNDWYVPARGGRLLQWAARESFPKAQRLTPKWHWSSTQFSRSNAYSQGFGNGDTGDDSKSWEGGRARPVRRFLIE